MVIIYVNELLSVIRLVYAVFCILNLECKNIYVKYIQYIIHVIYFLVKSYKIKMYKGVKYCPSDGSTLFSLCKCPNLCS